MVKKTLKFMIMNSMLISIIKIQRLNLINDNSHIDMIPFKIKLKYLIFNKLLIFIT